MTSILRRSFRLSFLRPQPFNAQPHVLRASSTRTSQTSEHIIAPGSENHHDLPSFLAYADRVNLSSDRSVYVGTHYEYVVAASLKRLGFSLTRTGRASDFGIDLLGTWTLPIPGDASPAPSTHPLRVLVQCKSSNKILSPKNVRELEGAFTGAPVQWRQEDFVGLLTTTKKATKGIIDALARSRWPMGFLKIEADGRVEQFLWNPSARARGLEGLGATVRYMLPRKEEGGELRTDIMLTWGGRPLPYVEAEETEALVGLQMETLHSDDSAEQTPEEQTSVEPSPEEQTPAGPSPDIEEPKPEKRKRGRPRKNKHDDVQPS